MLELKNINISYDKKECIRNGSFKAVPGNITGIYGESGTGKSSLLYVIGMLSNQVCEYYYNNELLEYNDKQKADFRNKHISFITQNSVMIETISVEKNIEFFLTMSDADISVDELLQLVHLSDKKNAMPNSLSGGERQRAAIACAIAKDSDIILGDELTSALDEDNKQVVMNLLRECANKGKMVILVSHEKKVLNECDVLYKIDHLGLILEKDNSMDSYNRYKSKIIDNMNLVKTYDLLFLSNKKQFFMKLLFSLFIGVLLFFLISIYQMNTKTISTESYYIDDISDNKLLVLSDISGSYNQNAIGQSFHVLYQFEPFQENIDEVLKSEKNIKKVYDYFIFEYDSINKSGYSTKMNLNAFRKGKPVEKHKSDILDMHVSSNGEYSFSILPFYSEDTAYKDTGGAYINSNMAYYFNLEVGDELLLTINVPFAMTQSINKETILIDSLNGKESEPYQKYFYISEQVEYKTKVLDIIESNTFDNELYIYNEELENLISQKIDEYNSGKLKINENAFSGYSYIVPLSSYAKVAYIDEKDNVLKVQNNIKKGTDKIFVYNEYQEIYELKIESDKVINSLILITIFITICIVLGIMVMEMIYLNKYNRLYLTLKFCGINNKTINKYFLFDFIMHLIMVIIAGFIIYISGSIPEILVLLGKGDLLDIYSSFPYEYRYYCYYTRFTLSHLKLFIVSSIGIIGFCHYLALRINKKRDLIKLLRKKV